MGRLAGSMTSDAYFCTVSYALRSPWEREPSLSLYLRMPFLPSSSLVPNPSCTFYVLPSIINRFVGRPFGVAHADRHDRMALACRCDRKVCFRGRMALFRPLRSLSIDPVTWEIRRSSSGLPHALAAIAIDVRFQFSWFFFVQRGSGEGRG